MEKEFCVKKVPAIHMSGHANLFVAGDMYNAHPSRNAYQACVPLCARMVKLVDTTDLKSVAANAACRFDSGFGHQ